MNFKIDLGLNEKRVRVGDIDLAAAAEDMAYAESALNTCETEQAIVVAAAENLERGMELSKAIAEKTQDEGVALAVGKEALTASLRMLGQASAASQITAGTESYAAGAEASEGMLKTLIEKAKEYTKKAWSFIRDLVAKVVKYVKGLFGKGDDTASQLEDLLKKAKDDKRTNLKVSEFDKATAKRLINNVKYLAKKQGSKGIDDSALKAEVTKVDGYLQADADKTDLEAITTTLKATATDAAGKFIKGAKDGTEGGSVTNTPMADIRGAIKKMLPGADDLQVLKVASDKEWHDSNSVLSNDDKELIIDKLDSDIDHADLFPLVDDSNSLSVLVVYTDAESSDLTDFNADNKDGADAFEVAKKVVNGIKVKTVTVTPESSDVEEYAEKLVPVPFNSAEKIVSDLKKATKTADTKARKIEKDVETAYKNASKALDTLEKDSAVKSNTPGGAGKAAQLARTVIGIVNNMAQAKSKALATNVKNAARPKWGDIIKESVRLYEK